MDDQPDIDLGAGGSESGLPEPGRDVFEDVEPDPLGGDDEPKPEETPAGRLGGDGETLEELEQRAEEPAEPEPTPEAEPEPVEEPVAEEPAAEEEAEAAPESEAADAAEAGKVEPEPEPAPSPGTKKAGTADREYVVLQEVGKKEYKEVLEPIRAGNGEAAIREAYAKLVPGDSEDSVTLVVVPSHFWKPKTVKAKAKVNRAIEID